MKRSISDYKSNFRSNSKTCEQCSAQEGQLGGSSHLRKLFLCKMPRALASERTDGDDNIYIYICIYMSTITIMIITYFNSNIIVAAEKIVTIFLKKYFEGRNCRCFKRHEEITDQLSAMKSS